MTGAHPHRHTVYRIPKTIEWHVAQRMPAVLEQELIPAVSDLRAAFTDVGITFDTVVDLAYNNEHQRASAEFRGDGLTDQQLRALAERLSGLTWRHGTYPDHKDDHKMPRAGALYQIELAIHTALTLTPSQYRTLTKEITEEVKRIFPNLARQKPTLKSEWTEQLAGAEGPLVMVGPNNTHAIDEMIAQLYAKAPWLDRPLRRVWALAKAWSGEGLRLPPILLHGDGGTGKSMLAQLIGEVSGVPCLEMDASGGSAAFRIAGVESGWSSAQIGEPLRFIAQTGCPNPIIIVNEMDKAIGGATSARGTATSLIHALLPMLDPHSAASYRCPATGLVLDLSKISWVFTANELSGLSQPLMTRLEAIHIPALQQQQYIQALDVLCPDDALLRDQLARFVSEEWQRPGFSLRLLARTARRLRGETIPMVH